MIPIHCVGTSAVIAVGIRADLCRVRRDLSSGARRKYADYVEKTASSAAATDIRARRRVLYTVRLTTTTTTSSSTSTTYF